MAKKIVRLTFPEKLIQEPIIYRIGHEFDVVTSIYRAVVGEKDAWIILELDGAEEEIMRVIEFLRSLEILVEEKSESEI